MILAEIIWPLPSRITMGQMFMFKAAVCGQAQDTHTHTRPFTHCESKSCPQACGIFTEARQAQGPNVDISGVFCAHTHTHTHTHTHALTQCHTHTGTDQTDAI